MSVESQIQKLTNLHGDIKTQYNISDLSIAQRKQLDIERTLCEQSFYEFVKHAWISVEGRENLYIDNWHIKALCDHLQGTYTKDIMKLIINLPIRCSKSTILMMFPAWVWTHSPHLTFMYVSYAQHTIADRDSRRCRDLVTSPWYIRLWGHKVRLRADANTLRRYYNTAGGYRMCTSFSAGVTGEGAHWIIFEDPNDKNAIFSPLHRERTNLEFDGGFSTRVANPKETRRILSQQRLHERDLTGYVLSKDNAKDWVHLCLPMEYVKKKRCITVPLKGEHALWSDPRTKEGELLWPQYWGRKEVDDIKKDLGSAYNVSSQLQMSPAADEGNIIKREWFRAWKGQELPKCEYVIMSWDTSFGTEDGAFSACTVWGIFELEQTQVPHIILLNAWRGRPGYPELRRIVKRMCRNYFDTEFEYTPRENKLEPDLVLIEAKATGSPLIEDLAQAGILAVPFDPTHENRYIKKQNVRYNSKEMRAAQASSLIEAGRVWLPMKPPACKELRSYADEFLEKACMFPAGDGADYVDSMSQAFIHIMKRQLTWHPEDEGPIIPNDFWKEKEPIY